MKLIDDFTARLEQDNLPHHLYQCFVVEDGDRRFEGHPFDCDRWDYGDLSMFEEDYARKYQFYRSKTSKQNLRIREEFYSCFDVGLVGQVNQIYILKNACEKMDVVKSKISSLTDKSDASVGTALRACGV